MAPFGRGETSLELSTGLNTTATGQLKQPRRVPALGAAVDAQRRRPVWTELIAEKDIEKNKVQKNKVCPALFFSIFHTILFIL